MPTSTELLSIFIREMSPVLIEAYKIESSRSNVGKIEALQREYLTGANVVNMAEGLKLKVSKCPACAAKMRSTADFRDQGRATWNYVHSRAAFYPEDPTPEERERFESAIMVAIESFPCRECADDALGFLAENPLDFTTRKTLQNSLCQLHNHVNEKIGKPLHGCDY